MQFKIGSLKYLLAVLGGLLAVAAEAAVLRVATSKEIESLDPVFVDGSEATLIAGAMFEGLVTLDAKTARAEPALASSWEISKDLKKIVFNIRPDAKWSDGKPVRAADFLFAWKRALSPATGAYYANLFDIIAGAESFRKGEQKDFSKVGLQALSPLRLQVTLRTPAAYALDLFAHPVFLPVREDLVSNAEWLSPGKAVVNGPFVLTEWKHKQKLTLAKNKNYFNAAAIQLEGVEVFPIESFKTALQMYDAGQIDWLRRVPAHLVTSLKSRSDFHTGPMLNTVYLRFNVKGQAFADKRLRKALSLAIDRQILAEKVAKEGQIPAERFSPPGLFSQRQPALLKAHADADMSLAKDLVAQVRKEKGNIPPVELLYISDEQSEKVATAISVMLKKNLDLSVSPKNLERGVFYNKLDTMKHDLARSSNTANYFDPMSFLEKFTTDNALNNLTGFSDARFDTLISKAAEETDMQKREKILAEAEAILVSDEVAIVPLYHNPSVNMWKPEVTGLFVNGLDAHPLRAIAVNRAPNQTN